MNRKQVPSAYAAATTDDTPSCETAAIAARDLDAGFAPGRRTSRRGASRLRGRRLRDVVGLVLVILGGMASIATNMADEAEPQGVSEDGAEVITCEAPEECAENEVNSHCMETYSLCVECLDDGHCGEQARCYEHKCATICTEHSQCGGELVCVDGLCVECQADTDCGDPGDYCYIGPTFSACRPLCSSSSDCTGAGYADGDVCRGGRCQIVECGAPQECVLDRETCDPSLGQCRSILQSESR